MSSSNNSTATTRWKMRTPPIVGAPREIEARVRFSPSGSHNQHKRTTKKMRLIAFYYSVFSLPAPAQRILNADYLYCTPSSCQSASRITDYSNDKATILDSSHNSLRRRSARADKNRQGPRSSFSCLFLVRKEEPPHDNRCSYNLRAHDAWRSSNIEFIV